MRELIDKKKRFKYISLLMVVAMMVTLMPIQESVYALTAVEGTITGGVSGDTTPPEVMAYPSDDVVFNYDDIIDIYYDEAIYTTSGDEITHATIDEILEITLKENNSEGEDVRIFWISYLNTSNFDAEKLIKINGDLKSDTRYYLSIEAVEDEYGNEQSGPFETYFTTAVDTTAPVLNSLMAGDSELNEIDIYFDEELENASVDISDFIVSGMSGGNSISLASVASSMIILTMEENVIASDWITVTYNNTGNSLLQDDSGNQVESFTNEVCDNEISPVIVSATIEGTTLVVDYDANVGLRNESDLITNGAIDASYFVVSVTDAALNTSVAPTITSASLVDGNVHLELASPVLPDDEVAYSYYYDSDDKYGILFFLEVEMEEWETRRLRSESDLMDVTNNTVIEGSGDLTAPQVQPTSTQIYLGQDGMYHIYVGLESEVLDQDADPSAFSVGGIEGGVTIAAVSVSDQAITLIVDGQISVNDVVTLTYAATGNNDIVNSGGNLLADFNNLDIWNMVSPVPVTGSISGSAIALTFDAPVFSQSDSGWVGEDLFIVKINGEPVGISSSAITGGSLSVTLAREALEGDVVTINYLQGSLFMKAPQLMFCGTNASGQVEEYVDAFGDFVVTNSTGTAIVDDGDDGVIGVVGDESGNDDSDDNDDSGSNNTSNNDDDDDDDSEETTIILEEEAIVLADFGYEGPYIDGYLDGRFHGEWAISRAEIAKIVALIFDLDYENASDSSFDDVSEGFWGRKYINVVTELELIDPLTATTFGPDESMTRAEVAAVIAKCWEYIGYEADATETTLIDVSGHSDEASINMLFNEGLVKGFGDQTFRPDNELLREQAVVIFNGLIGRPVYDGYGQSFSDVDETLWSYGYVEAATRYYKEEEGFLPE